MQKCCCLYYISSLNIIWSSVHRSHSRKVPWPTADTSTSSCRWIRLQTLWARWLLFLRATESACKHFELDGRWLLLLRVVETYRRHFGRDNFYFFVSLSPAAETLGAIASTSSCRWVRPQKLWARWPVSAARSNTSDKPHWAVCPTVTLS